MDENNSVDVEVAIVGVPGGHSVVVAIEGKAEYTFGVFTDLEFAGLIGRYSR